MSGRSMVVLLPPVVLFCSLVERPEYLRLVGHIRTRLDPWGVRLVLARDHPQSDRSIEAKWRELIDASSGMLALWSRESNASSAVLHEYAYSRERGKPIHLIRVPSWGKPLPVLPVDFSDREWFKLEGAAPSMGDWVIDEAAFQATVKRIYEFAAGLAA